MNQISILGCGWLGLPLANSLLKKGFSVKGSTTSIAKISILETNKIQPFLIRLSENNIEGEIEAFLENSSILIIDIPPQLRKDSSENFVSKIQNLLPFIEKSSIQKVLFVSSTSVYADGVTPALIIAEETKPHPDTEGGKQLLEAEQLLQNNSNFKTTIIRFGGLIGEDRHPIHYLTGRKNLKNPEAPINLIHQNDCIGIIETILCHANPAEVWGKNFNAVAPYHPTRKAYYTQKAIELNLALPEFEVEKKSIGKIILSDKIQTLLGYQFQNTIL